METPTPFEPILKLPPIESVDEPQEKFVVPLSRHGEISLAEQSTSLFNKEEINEIVSAINLETINESVNMAIPHKDRQQIVMSEEEVLKLAKQDVQERALDKTSIHISALGKTDVANLYLEAINAEQESMQFSQRADVNRIVLEKMTIEITQKKQELEDLALSALNISTDSLEDAQNVQQLKQELMFDSHTLASLGESTERVSPEMSASGDFR